jgi:predicted O-methyltransferase YrrM
VDALALVESIPGWLRQADAEKLYELARATPGPIVEIGTFHGKSAVLMALAAKDAGRDTTLYTLDVDRSALRAASAEAEARGVADRIVFVRGTLAAFVRAYPHVRPELTFVDGDHTRAGVERDLAILQGIVPAGGKLLFHDFDDPLNEDPACDEIRVRPAVQASWVARACDFDGAFGCCGLFTRRDAGPAANAAVADLLRLDDARDQYVHRVRNPAGGLLRRIRQRR